MAIDTPTFQDEGANGRDRDMAGLRLHVTRLLRTGLGPDVHFHDPAHTLESVVPAADRLALAEGVSDESRRLIHAAALLHDTGYTEGSADHEQTSARIARQTLPDFGFGPDEIERIVRLILATKLGYHPATVEERILADADLDLLGRDDFWDRSLDLRRELAAGGVHYDERGWTERQIEFLTGHRYHTESARRLRQPGKAENLRRLRDHLQELLGRV